VDQPPRFVSRGGEKLEAGLRAFSIRVQGEVCADVGASTGGFTDCLLQHGAARVYAIDVGHGVLHWRLRGDPRVVVMEKTNARHLSYLPEPVGFVCVDASFISLKLLLPSIRGWLKRGADLLLLVKPQFEAGRKEVGRGGVVRREDVRRSVLQGLLPAAEALGLGPQGLIRSPLLGPKGNMEFLLWCRLGAPASDLAASILAATAAADG
jgi:23S rRNA (cytidine1920-2'-O)/16S rRNA (cytidine1409-2'-O)-methyltransferase